MRGLLEDGQSVLVGWQIDQDLGGLRLNELTNHARVLDLSQYISTQGGAKCQLGEACAPEGGARTPGPVQMRAAKLLVLTRWGPSIGADRTVFSRDAQAHDACDDAKMTMELFTHWRRAGMAPIVLPMEWHFVHWVQMQPARWEELRWDVLRPERCDRDTCREEELAEELAAAAAEGGAGAVAGAREYRLRFRRASDRVAYFNLAKRRLHQRGYSQEFPQFLGDREGSVAFAVCTANVYEQPR